jgi:hypothetical protein
MAIDRTHTIEQDLNDSLEELRLALQHAADATASLQRIVPRVAQIGTFFDEIANVVNTGRQQLGIADAGATYSRPTIVPSSTPAPDLKNDDPWTSLAQTWGNDTPSTTPAPATTQPAATSVALTCFRLEFESKPGPLDLRSVDDAVGEHPAVRDVALLDYDGRKATLKVWIEQGTDPATVRDSLVEKATALFGTDNDVTVTAHEEAA